MLIPLPSPFLFTLVFSVSLCCVSASLADGQISAQELAAQFGLTTSTIMPFPTATQSSSDSQKLLTSRWSLTKGRIQNGASNLQFVQDPFPNSTALGTPTVSTPADAPVLRVTYPAGSFSNAGSTQGGAQFYSLWNTSDGSSFESMMLSYEIAFDTSFDWVKGGKLPGLRGGLNDTGCSGGSQATPNCFSSRVMWRQNAEGEVYAYIPTPNNLCSESGIICNSDFGTSIDRGSFSFVSGQWSRVTLLVQLNNPPDVANGNIQLYYNDLLAVSHKDLQIRSVSSLDVNGLYFSTFFGGSDSSWATPNTVNSYFRNMQLWGGTSPSNLTGNQVTTSLAVKNISPWWFVPLVSLVTAAVLA